MASRNEAKALAAIAQLEKETGRQAIFLRLDLADLKSVRAAAQEFMRSVLHMSLINSCVGRAER